GRTAAQPRQPARPESAKPAPPGHGRETRPPALTPNTSSYPAGGRPETPGRPCTAWESQLPVTATPPGQQGIWRVRLRKLAPRASRCRVSRRRTDSAGLEDRFHCSACGFVAGFGVMLSGELKDSRRGDDLRSGRLQYRGLAGCVLVREDLT